MQQQTCQFGPYGNGRRLIRKQRQSIDGCAHYRACCVKTRCRNLLVRGWERPIWGCQRFVGLLIFPGLVEMAFDHGERVSGYLCNVLAM